MFLRWLRYIKEVDFVSFTSAIFLLDEPLDAANSEYVTVSSHGLTRLMRKEGFPHHAYADDMAHTRQKGLAPDSTRRNT